MGKYYNGTIQSGSTGADVKAWQQFLKSQGYSLDIDGIFGSETEKYTKEYQKANGLGVDGIVGEMTYAKAGFSNINTPIAAPTIGSAPNLPTFNSTNFDDTTEGKNKADAKDSALEEFNNYGEHNWEYADVNKQLLDKYLNRDPFSYDLNGDALYQQYKDKYIQQGKLAMQDTMGQASAMTGGYGSSYAQSVGQQAYQNSLDYLNDIVPELWQMAYDRYNQEGQNMVNQLGVLDADYNRSFGEWETGYNVLKDKYNIANDDYYNSEGSYNANRDTANNLAQYDYTNRFNAWEVDTANAWQEWDANEGARRWEIENRRAEEELDLKKNSLNQNNNTDDNEFRGTVKTDTNANGTKTFTYTPDKYEGKYETTIPVGYTYQETDNTQLFQASIKTKNEFYTRGGSDKQKYGTYEKYIEGILDKWLGEGKLNEDEVATLIAYYGLS